MARHLKVVRGGGDGTVSCACNKLLAKVYDSEIRCQCIEEKYFVQMPARWICDRCAGGSHVRTF